ncbi:hypothetical protein R6Q57_011194 [Mikania cordata]
MGITPTSKNVALLSAINFQASGSQIYQTPSSQSVPFETAFLSSGQVSSVPKINTVVKEGKKKLDEKPAAGGGFRRHGQYSVSGEKGKGLGYKECEPPFNHNYSTIPRINTYVDDLVLQSDHAFEFPTESVSLTVDQMFVSDDSYVNMAHSTITKEVGSKLNPNFEPYVPTGSLEQASASTSHGQGDCDVKPFDPKDFHEKVCYFACGRPDHIARYPAPTY